MSAVGPELDEMQEIVNDFLVEANELVASLETNLVKLEETPKDLDLLNEIFRAAHTIKGTSGFLGLDIITDLTHKMEDVLNKLRKEELQVNSDIMDILLESVDLLKTLHEDVAEGRKNNTDTDAVKTRLTDIAEGRALNGGRVLQSVPDSTHSSKKDNSWVESAPDKTNPDFAVKTEIHHKNIEQTIRIDVNRLDNLMNLMGELVLGRNSLVQTAGVLSREHEGLKNLDELSRSTAQINFITTEIQMAVMKMRMLPVAKVFSKFPRIVRDLAREMHKKIELDIYGEETELDKSVIEEIGDPLIHLVRNSCDHGIESPEERIARGKPEIGGVRLGAKQEGSNIVISIEDDGRGMDIEAITKKVLDRKLVSAEAIDKLSAQEIYRFIFQPGFSTAPKITDISGRGVGMDVVRTNIEKLKGMIEIESNFGHGSKITIKLPLTLAIIQGLLVTSEGETYIIPLASVLEALRISEDQIDSVNRQEVISLREGVLPIVNLHDLLRGARQKNRDNKRPYVVVVGLAEKRLGLIVDDLLGQEEVVIKSMSELLGVTKGVAGATILGDGRVRLIVDLIGLFELAGN
jgi:two-component system chemotaxis sensor kinase CheA